MSNSAYIPPVPPIPGQPEQPKKKKWWIYGLIGCAGIIVIIVVVVILGGVWVAKQGEEKIISFAIEKANPDLEVLSLDKDAGTISVKSKKTGETFTMSVEDAKQGKFTLKNDKGETVTFNADGAGTARIETEKGTSVIGAAAVENIPAWVAIYPGTNPQGAWSGEEEGKKNGAMSFATTDTVAQVIDFYKEKLAAEGLQGDDQANFGGTEQYANYTARSEGQRRTVTVSASRETADSETRVNVMYEEKAEGNSGE